MTSQGGVGRGRIDGRGAQVEAAGQGVWGRQSLCQRGQKGQPRLRRRAGLPGTRGRGGQWVFLDAAGGTFPVEASGGATSRWRSQNARAKPRPRWVWPSTVVHCRVPWSGAAVADLCRSEAGPPRRAWRPPAVPCLCVWTALPAPPADESLFLFAIRTWLIVPVTTWPSSSRQKLPLETPGPALERSPRSCSPVTSVDT